MCQPTPINTIVMQCDPHQDSRCAAWLLRREGEERFPGIQNAAVEYWGWGTYHPEGKTWREYVKEGKLPVGVAGSPLDEHASEEFGDRKKQGHSTTSLVAEMLGISDKPLYKKLIEVVTHADLNLVPKDHPSSIVKIAHRDPSIPEKDIRRYCDITFKQLLASELRSKEDEVSADDLNWWNAFASKQLKRAQIRFKAALNEIKMVVRGDRPGLITERKIGTRTLRVIGIDTDNPAIGLAASYSYFDICIQYRSTGHVGIYTNPKSGLCLRMTAATIRRLELIKMGRSDLANAEDWAQTLTLPGQLACVPNWCLVEPGNFLLNSSDTANALERTIIDIRDIHKIVTETIRFAQQKDEVNEEIAKPALV